jgi:hypothetical protein
MTNVFPNLILNALPAAGKSEIIDFLTSQPLEERKRRFRVGHFKVFDDFPILWSWFEEDEILESVFSLPRLHSTHDRYFKREEYWHVLIRRLCQEVERWRRDGDGGQTAIIEFSRGEASGGYQAAYQHMSKEVLLRAACLYVRVSSDESLRKNRARYNPERPDSLLEHSLSDEKMRRLYSGDDWSTFTQNDPEYLYIQGLRVPYGIFENEDDVTTRGGAALGERLEKVMLHLWRLREIGD